MNGITPQPDDVMLADLAREAVLLFAGSAALFLVPLLVMGLLRRWVVFSSVKSAASAGSELL